MPICIECRYPVHQLYTAYKAADDRSLGKGVRLTQCPRCKRFADKYVEHDFVVLFIDLVLIKPQVYRHLLFNRLERQDDRFNPSIVRLGVLLLLFDVYLTWRRIEKATPASPQSSSGLTANGDGHYDGTQHTDSFISTQPLFLQYIFFLLLCTLSTASFHLPIHLLCAHPPRVPTWVGQKFPYLVATTSPTTPVATSAPGSGLGASPAMSGIATFSSSTPFFKSPKLPSPSCGSTPGASTPNIQLKPPSPETSMSRVAPPTIITPPHLEIGTLPLLPYYPHPAPLSTALLVSSCTKLFPILLIIWGYDVPTSASAVAWAVILNNTAALDILMDCGFARAAVLVGVGATTREVVIKTVLRLVGIEGWRTGVGDILGVVREAKAVIWK